MNDIQIQEKYQAAVDEFVRRALRRYEDMSGLALESVKKGFVEDVYGRALSHAKDRSCGLLLLFFAEKISFLYREELSEIT